MNLREQIAFNVWNDTNPEIAKGHAEGVLQKSLGNGSILELDLGLDWALNKDTFLRMADIAIATISAPPAHTEDR